MNIRTKSFLSFILISNLCLHGISATDILFPIGTETVKEIQPINEIISLNQLSSEMIKAFQEGDKPNMVIEVPQNAIAPVEFFLRGQLLALDGPSPMLKVKVLHTFYMKMEQDGCLFSLDLAEWKPLSEMIIGNACMTVDIENQRPKIRLGAEINKK